MVDCYKPGISEEDLAISLTTGADVCITAAQRSQEHSAERNFGGKMFSIKQTLGFVICCQRTQMQLVNLALRFHKQKKSSAHVGSGKQAATASRRETLT